MNQKQQNKNNQDSQNREEGFFERLTKPVGMPKPNTQNIPFDKWDWKANDPIFYESFHRLPDSKKKYIKKNMYIVPFYGRYNQSIYQAEGPGGKPDFRPRTFIRKMKWELLVLAGGISMGLMLPTFVRWNREKQMTREREEQSRQRVYQSPQDGPRGVMVNQNLRNVYGEQQRPATPDERERLAQRQFAQRVEMISQEEMENRAMREKNPHGLGSGYFKY